jgi:hypothetical protein
MKDLSRRKQTTIAIDENMRIESVTIAKRQGFNTFTALVNRLVYEYVEKNREVLDLKPKR